MESNIIRVTISEASRLFGVDPKTLRRAIKQKEIKYVVVRGRYKLHFESVLQWSQKRTVLKNKLKQDGIGKFVEKWNISNTLYSPNPKTLDPPSKENSKK